MENEPKNFIYEGKYVFGIYFDKEGYPQIHSINITEFGIKIETVREKLILDFMDVYLMSFPNHCNIPEDFEKNKFVPFVEVHDIILYNCNNLNQKAFLQLHNCLPYHKFNNELDGRRKIFFSNYNDHLILDNYDIECSDKTNFRLKPFLFGHLVYENSILNIVEHHFPHKTVFRCNLDFNKVKKFFCDYMYMNRIPKLCELVENRLVENIGELYYLCDYFNIQIYLDYFKIIISHESFQDLFFVH